MNEGLINNWNKVVNQDSTVYILGDFSFAKDQSKTQQVIRRLNGKYKHLVKGNHDSRLNAETLAMFSSVQDYAEITYYGQPITMLHYPMLTWNGSHRGSWSLHGHCHSSLPDDPSSLRLDVGVDCPYTNYAPISFEAIKTLMSKKTWKPKDYHGER